ncbi:MAG: heavy metal translocating P-type ATPase, partial [Angelakisella sp.]
MTEHQHDHNCAHSHEHEHDHNSNSHCHCSSCELQHKEGGSTPKKATSDHDDGCGCHCGEDSGGDDDPPARKTLLLLGAGTLAFVAALLLPGSLPPYATLLLFLAAYFLIGGGVLLQAAKNLLHGQLFDETFLMAVATIGAFAIGEYPEGVAVMLFYRVGEFFQSYAVGRSRRSITKLMDIRPDYANLVLPDGTEQRVPPDTVPVGAEIHIKPGERIPLDSLVLEGSSWIDTAALTGESVPRQAQAGEALLSGCINQTGLLRARVEKEFGQSTVSKILELTENASSKKAVTQQFITRFARIYTPLVVLAATLLAVLPPLLLPGALFSDWLYRALVFLVISCPCALVISVPLSFFGGIGGASRCGVLVKGGNYLELLAKADIVVFDKTGTLTKGVFEVTAVEPKGVTGDELLCFAAAAECYSTHPIALSILAAVKTAPDRAGLSDSHEIAGQGVSVVQEGKLILAGNRKLLEGHGIAVDAPPPQGTELLVAVDGQYCGRLLIADRVKEDAKAAIARLKTMGVRKTVLLTGDGEAAAALVSGELGLDSYRAQLLPGDKVAAVERLLGERVKGGSLVFVGDGINDAPVLARADIGVAMGGLGSDAAIEAADIVLMTDQPMQLATGIAIARKTTRIVRQNVIFALGVKLAVLLLGAFGFVSMWLAVFADV